MKAKSVLRKMASRIHGRRATYPIYHRDGESIGLKRHAVRTCLRYDSYSRRYVLQLFATCDADCSPANTLQVN